MMTDFYKDQNVVVLGGAGFVGRHLCRALLARRAIVWVIDDLSRGEPDTTLSASDFTRMDITNGMFGNLLSSINPFAVFNLAAAVAGVEYNQKHHNQMFLDNVNLQTIPVIVCERLGVPHFLQVSSACVYGEKGNASAIEAVLGGEPVGANAGYSWAKRMGERAVQWTNLQHAVIVRPSNIYGPGDWYDERAHVIPKLIKKYDRNAAKMFGDGSPVRQFIYVTDVAEGMLYALEHGLNKEVYNLAPIDDCNEPTDALSMRHLHYLVAETMETTIAPQCESPFDLGDAMRFSDGSKMKALGWSAATPFEVGLKKTIEAYFETK